MKVPRGTSTHTKARGGRREQDMKRTLKGFLANLQRNVPKWKP